MAYLPPSSKTLQQQSTAYLHRSVLPEIVATGDRNMWAGGEGNLDSWTAALAARLQLDSPHASRQPSLPASPAATPPPNGAAEVVPPPAAGFPQPTPQQAGPAQEAPPRQPEAPPQGGQQLHIVAPPAPPPFAQQHGQKCRRPGPQPAAPAAWDARPRAWAAARILGGRLGRSDPGGSAWCGR